MVISGLVALLVMIAMGCDNSGREAGKEPSAARPASTETASVAPTAQPAGPESPDELRSDKERSSPEGVSDENLADLVGGNSEFAFDLYQNLKSEDGNLFYSPYSISVALAMIYAGARGETERQMADTLHYLLRQEGLHPAFNALDMELVSPGEGARGKDDGGFKLNVVNALWGQDGCGFAPAFLDTLAQSYGAGVRPMHFLGLPEESRTTINDWVSDQTEKRIQDLIPEGVIGRDTIMVLTNAIYFKAAWLIKFSDHNTRDLQFHLIDGSDVTVPMMSQSETLGYASGEGYQAVELLYEGGDLSMTVLLPDEGLFREFEESLTADMVGSVVGEIERKLVSITMPKFEFESAFRLADTLEAMGMQDVFDQRNADLSGMGISGCPGGGGNPFVSAVVHKAFVLVEEEGTEAAAATAVVVRETSGPAGPPIEMTLDRPFLFLIRDRATEAILFVGRVENPKG